MNIYYFGGMLGGAFVIVFLLSRLLLACAKAWPNSYWKFVFFNVLSGIIAILLGIIGHTVSAGGKLAGVAISFVAYGSMQIVVFLIDILRLRNELKKSRSDSPRTEPRFDLGGANSM